MGEVLDALAQTSPANTRTELQAAARSFERATRSHIQAPNSHNQALRRAARDLVQSGPALGKGEDGAATAMLLSILITAAVMAMDNRELTTAGSPTDVLLWRLRHEAGLPAAPPYVHQQRRPTATPRAAPPTTTPAKAPSRGGDSSRSSSVGG